MLSAGIPIIQNANEAKPPERKFAVGVLICGETVVGGPTAFVGMYLGKCRARTSYFVPCSLENPRMSSWQVRRNVQLDWNGPIAGALLTSYDPNSQAKLLLKARLPVKPVQSPSTPWLRTICRMASMGPLYCLSATDLCDCICSFTDPSTFRCRMTQC